MTAKANIMFLSKNNTAQRRTTRCAVFVLLDKLEFGDEPPLTMRARCSAFRYCPDPLGIVTAKQLVKLEFIVLTKTVQGFFRDDILSKPFCLSPK